MTSFLKPPQKDSRKLITDSAHEDKKGRANNSRRESKQMSELKAPEHLTRSKWKPLHLCRDNLRRGQSRNHKVWWEEADRKSGLRALDPTGPLLYLERKKKEEVKLFDLCIYPRTCYFVYYSHESLGQPL